ncbi:MAG: hypothetical protein LCH77_01285 [Actinobacteria bacterium]|nr:hypothetical protein [Actinomycetota bacterium]
MPTTRPRHMVTESDDLADALTLARRHWPQETSDSRLIALLAQEGARAISIADATQVVERRHRLRAHAGILRGTYGPDYLERLREDWPG